MKQSQIMKKINTQSGITLIALIITIVVMLIVATTGIYASVERLKTNNVKKMFTDIEMLDNRVLDYYAVNEMIPLVERQGTIIEIGEIKDVEGANNLAILDLSKLGQISLIYGRDFEDICRNPDNLTNNSDLYVINQNTFQIFYLKGITANGITYHTKEKKTVNISDGIIAYIDGEAVPNEENSYYCKSKIKYMNVKNSNSITEFSVYKEVEGGTFERIIDKNSKLVTEIVEDGNYQIRKDDEEIPLVTFKVSHQWRNWSVKDPSTCNKNGKEIRTCEICGKEETKELPKTEHQYGEVYRRIINNLYMYRERTCKICEHKEDILEAYVGDYINYNCFDGVETNKLTYTATDQKTGYTTENSSGQTISILNNYNWRIIGVEDNQLLVTTTDSIPKISLNGKSGVENGSEIFDDMSGIFGHGEYADENKYKNSQNINTGGRSITINDIENIYSYDHKKTLNYGKTYKYSKESDGYIYTNGNKPTLLLRKKIFNYYDGERWNSLSNAGDNIEITNTQFYHKFASNSSPATHAIIYNSDDGTANQLTYVLNNLRIQCEIGFLRYNFAKIGIGEILNVINDDLYSSNDLSETQVYRIRPVVCLQRNAGIIGGRHTTTVTEPLELGYLK